MSLPLIVTGMHRSGTSLTASFIKAIGVELGDNLYKADRFNVKGYFEDLDFLEFQRSLLQGSCPPGDPGWPDWGWTESESLDRGNFHRGIAAAKALIAQRSNNSGIWGWKDPRTSLMLDFWHQLLPEARYLFVYRLPWDVADSILRLNAGIFSARPDYAIRTWAYYNLQILDFYQQHRDRCILLNVNAFLEQPMRLVELLETKLELRVNSPLDPRHFHEIYDPKLFKQLDGDRPLVRFLQNPELPYISILEKLDWVADLPSNFALRSSESLPLETYPLWLHHEAVQAKIERDALTTQVEAEKQEVQAECDRLRQEIAQMKLSKFWKIKEKWSAFKSAIVSKLTVKSSQL